MDRKSLIGFFLMMIIASAYFFYANYEQKKYNESREKEIADSTALAQKNKVQSPAPIDTLQITDSSNISDSNRITTPEAFSGKSELIELSNELINVKFNTKGGSPDVIEIKKYKTYTQQPLIFQSGQDNYLSIKLPLDGKDIETKNITFTPQLSSLGDTAKQLTLTAELGNNKQIIYQYTLPNNSYVFRSNIRITGMNSDLAGVKELPLVWSTKALRTEKDLKNERLYAQVHWLYTDNEHDYFTIKLKESESIERPVKWISTKTHFFNSTLIADNSFGGGTYKGVEAENDSSYVMHLTNNISIPIQSSNDVQFSYQWMMSPNDYNFLKSFNLDFEEMIPLGYGIFFFIKYISKWIVIPLWTFLTDNMLNMGLAIILLTVIIRFFLSFLNYKSYLSSAKMRVLKPELDALREKFKDNQQQMGMEQMNLYRTAGVNPLGGCLPMLIQMPFLLAMYYFIPHAIELRQSKFLWSEDLSTYDSIASWSQQIPLLSSVYGNHISLFTLLMTATSLFLALFNKNLTNTASMGGDGGINMKMMKYMPYIMPIMFLGWFNSFAAGLTFYYTFSNLLSILQQWVIQKFFINEEAIHAKIQKKRSEPKKTSKWQQRLEEMQKMQSERNKKIHK